MSERNALVHVIAEQLHIAKEVAEVILVLDISGSMKDLYESGEVQKLIERILPIALEFDDNNSVELFLFHDSAYQHGTNITMQNVAGFVKREIMGNYPYGGTSYAPVINMIAGNKPAPKPGFSFSRIFSSASSTSSSSTVVKTPKYVIFITDGDNNDKSAAEQAIKDASGMPIFFQFVGIGNSATFEFLEKLDTMPGRVIDNANFFQANDLDYLSDEDLYNKLLAEFPDWLSKARAANILAPLS